MPELPTSVDVVIIGAGLAGLSCARATVAAGLETLVVEQSDGVGGRVRTDVVDGYRLDRGFQILLTGYPEVQAQLDLDALELCRFEPGALIYNGAGFDRLVDPFRMPSRTLSTVRSGVGTLVDKARVAKLRHDLISTPAAELLRRPETTTVEALRGYGFSEEMIDRFFSPLFGGISLDPTLQSSSRMFDVIFRTLALGDTAVPASGMEAVPRQLAASLPEGVVQLDQPVESVLPHAVRLGSGATITATAVVVAVAAPAAAQLLGVEVPASKAQTCIWFAAEQLPYPGRTLMLDGVGRGPVVNLAPMSAVAPTYAPPGRHLLAASCPNVFDPGSLVRDARTQLEGWLGPNVASWKVLRTDVISHAQPSDRLPFAPKRTVRLGDGRYICGDWRDTPSLQGAMFSGRRCGETVVLDLGARLDGQLSSR